MAALVPAPVERRIRRKWSRRAKLTGFGIITTYLAAMVALFASGYGFWFFVATAGSFAAGFRYFRLAQRIESADPDLPSMDPVEEELRRTYEAKIFGEAQRHVAGGSVSIAPVTDGRGELSVADADGALSRTEE